MSPVVHVVMFGWVPAVVGLFSFLKPRHAVIASFLIAWLFLPVARYEIPGLPDYTKISATCFGIFLAAAIFDAGSLSRFRLRTLDIPMIVWCLCPIASSLTNGYGIYDGLAMSLRQVIQWGFPYFIGRVYFSSGEGLRDLAVGIFIGGMIYVPLCLYEIRFSPQLHNLIYGFHQHTFAQTLRWGAWRPMVFLDHGLMLGAWMMSASLVGVWLWRTGVLKDCKGMPAGWMVLLLLLTTVLCRSTGAAAQLFMGCAALFMTRRLQKPLFLILLIAIPLLYIPARVSGAWTGENLVSLVSTTVSRERADSLAYRMFNEKILWDKARKKPVFGWGTWGGARVYDDQGKDISVTDGLWIISLGNHGMVGLVSMTLSILMPLLMLIRSLPARLLDHPAFAPASALSVLMGLYMVDCLLNAMINPVFMVMAGGVTGFCAFLPATAGEPEVEPAAVLAYSPRFL
jgi:hypothetical protein